jgi:hypothetical protein
MVTNIVVLGITVGNMKSAAFKEQNYQFKIKVNMKTKTSILALTKAFFILLVMCCLFSCNDGKGKISTDVQVIDGCEYIVSRNSYGNVVSHKGNCNNPIHKQVIHDTIYVVKAK